MRAILSFSLRLTPLLATLLASASAAGLSPEEHGEAKPFMPGVGVNWAEKVVEVEARVVLREGMLELAACSPNTREHESILQIRARPLHVYQALGLIGLEAGRPPHWDPQTNQPRPASGPPLAVRVRYEREGEPLIDDISAWLWDARANEPVPPLAWVFSGSAFHEGGRFAADLEGTVLCVVDFDSALISLAQSYSSANSELWITPNEQRIPPIGSPAVLLIQALPASLRTVTLGRYGRICYQGIYMGKLQLLDALRRELHEAPDLTVELIVDARAWPRDVEALSDLICQLGIPHPRIRTTPQGDDAPPALRMGLVGVVFAIYGDIILDGLQSSWTELRACLDEWRNAWWSALVSP